MLLIGLLAALALVVISCGGVPAGATAPRAQRLSYQVVATYTHDSTAYTEGLVWVDGQLYESTGLYGLSTLRRLDLASGKVVQLHSLVESDFGEGVTAVGDRLVQLTWQGHHGYVYDRRSFTALEQFSYSSEGWGLTYDGRQLIMSDGSASLHFLDPITYRPTRTLAVTMDDKPLTQLNELEYIHGEIWANVWHRDIIVCIDPRTGIVSSYIDLARILPPGQMQPSKEAVLNGIAYDPYTNRILVTGKLWPILFALRVPAAG